MTEVIGFPKSSGQDSELKAIISLAIPSIISNLLTVMILVVSQVMVGHLGADALAIASLSNSFFNLIWYFIEGVMTGLDTLAAQAFGANDFAALYRWAKIANYSVLILCVPFSLFLIFSKPLISVIFSESPEIVHETSIFCAILAPGLFPFGVQSVYRRVLQARNIMMPAVWVAVLSNILNVAGNFIFMNGLGYGAIGAAISTTLSRFIGLGAMWIFWKKYEVPIKPIDEYNDDKNDKAEISKFFGVPVHAIQAFLKIGITGGFMIAIEVWSFEITSMFAGKLGTIIFGAHMIMFTIIVFSFLAFPFAISIAAGIRVGNLMGANCPEQAKQVSKICLLFGTCFMSCFGLVVYLARDYVPYMFTTDPEVIKKASDIARITSLIVVLDGAQGILSGILRGMGKQHIILVADLIGLWIFGVALGAFFAFYMNLGINGLWWGILCGVGTLCVILCTILYRIDWYAEAKIASTQYTSGENVSNEPDRVIELVD